MDCETGEIIEPGDFELMVKAFGQHNYSEDFHKRFKEMKIPPTPVQMNRRPPSVGRKDLCPCGSGLQFRHCCRYIKASER